MIDGTERGEPISPEMHPALLVHSGKNKVFFWKYSYGSLVKEREKRKTKLKELISQAELTQRELSIRTGMTEKAINDLVRGVSFPRLDRAALLARELGVSFKQLCEALGIATDGIPDEKDRSGETAHNSPTALNSDDLN